MQCQIWVDRNEATKICDPASPIGRRSQKGGGNGKRTLVIGRMWATFATMILSTMTVRLVRILLVIWFTCADCVALRKARGTTPSCGASDFKKNELCLNAMGFLANSAQGDGQTRITITYKSINSWLYFQKGTCPARSHLGNRKP
jgi:hypothetical protein